VASSVTTPRELISDPRLDGAEPSGPSVHGGGDIGYVFDKPAKFEPGEISSQGQAALVPKSVVRAEFLDERVDHTCRGTGTTESTESTGRTGTTDREDRESELRPATTRVQGSRRTMCVWCVCVRVCVRGAGWRSAFGAAIEPYNSVMEGLPGPFIPHHGRLALVGDANSREIRCLDVRNLFHGLLERQRAMEGRVRDGVRVWDLEGLFHACLGALDDALRVHLGPPGDAAKDGGRDSRGSNTLSRNPG